MEQINSLESIFPQPVTSTAKGSGNDLGQEDFMQLLVAQLENQDPAKPMDNFQFLSQIAQFGMVDGIQDLQGSFSNVADSFKQGQMMQAASLLGRQVLTESSSAIFDGRAVEGTVSVPASATNVLLEIKTTGGVTVRSAQMGVVREGAEEFMWDGTDNNGIAVPPGEYVISAKGDIQGTVQDFAVNTMSAVESVTIDTDGSLLLSLATGEQIGLDDIARFK